MGKSRVVDEMSKANLVIPVNLREPKSTGICLFILVSPFNAECSRLQDILLETVRHEITLLRAEHNKSLSFGAAPSSMGYLFRQLQSSRESKNLPPGNFGTI